MRKNQIISVFLIFALSALFHSIYEWFPSFITSLFFPVNESIWEHNKMILTSYLAYLPISAYLYRNDKKNIITTTLITYLLTATINTLIFTPVYFYILNYQNNVIVTLTIYFISILISSLIGIKLLDKPYNKTHETISTIIIILTIILLAYLTYNPLHLPLFYDYSNQTYGLK